jgi:CRP-like cAMP-binding protein
MEINNRTVRLARFRKKMESLTPITDDEFNQFSSVMHEKCFNRGEVILKEGQVCKSYYFIISGCIRSFCLKEGREVNVNFYFEDDTACDFKSFRMEEPSEVYMVAMEDCIVLYGTKTEAVPFLLKEVSLHLFAFRFFQQLYFEEEKHSISFKLLSPEERYQYIFEHKPQYLGRIPLIHLASYLGTSRETLSRIRKKMS